MEKYTHMPGGKSKKVEWETRMDNNLFEFYTACGWGDNEWISTLTLFRFIRTILTVYRSNQFLFFCVISLFPSASLSFPHHRRSVDHHTGLPLYTVLYCVLGSLSMRHKIWRTMSLTYARHTEISTNIYWTWTTIENGMRTMSSTGGHNAIWEEIEKGHAIEWAIVKSQASKRERDRQSGKIVGTERKNQCAVACVFVSLCVCALNYSNLFPCQIYIYSIWFVVFLGESSINCVHGQWLLFFF